MFGELMAIRAEGFDGFKTVGDLRASRLREVPEVPGVYLLVRTDPSPPRFLARSTGGHFKGKDPTVDVAVLADKWVTTSPVVYVGKAGGGGTASTLRSRLSLYLRFGAGAACGHWGGRYVWQLEDADSLVVCWKPTADVVPRDIEMFMLVEFVRAHSKLPFANCVG